MYIVTFRSKSSSLSLSQILSLTPSRFQQTRLLIFLYSSQFSFFTTIDRRRDQLYFKQFNFHSFLYLFLFTPFNIPFDFFFFFGFLRTHAHRFHLCRYFFTPCPNEFEYFNLMCFAFQDSLCASVYTIYFCLFSDRIIYRPVETRSLLCAVECSKSIKK